MAHWEEVLEAQVRLMRWWRTPGGHKYAQGFAKDVIDKERAGGEMYSIIDQIEAAKLERAEPVWVDEHVTDLVEFAMETAKPEPMKPEDLFCAEGFAYLPRQVGLEDVHGRKAGFRAFSWGPVLTEDEEGRRIPALTIALYAHMFDDDDYTPELRETLLQRFGGNTPEARGRLREVWGGDLSLYHVALFPWGTVPDDLTKYVKVESSGELTIDYSALTLWKWTQSFFRLAEQRVTERTREHGDRHTRKRLARLQPENDGVLVVTLRRPKAPAHPDHEPGDVDWQQQWIVSGHWRNQWYPTLGEHRQIWISPYVKGPEDKPLVLHAGRAFEFKR